MNLITFCIRKTKILAAICLLLGSVNAKGQSVSVAIDSNNVELANPVKFTITANVKAGQRVGFPAFQNNTIVPELEIIKSIKPDTIRNIDNTVTFTHSYLITAYSDSTFTIPQLSIRVGNDTLKTDSISISFTLLHVDSAFTASIDTTQMLHIFDINTVKNAPWTFQEFWQRFGKIILITILALLIGCIITYIVMRKIRNKPIIPIEKPKIPAHETALSSLKKLQDEKLWQQGQTKEYYSKLTDIIKFYVSERYGTSVMESTSNETLQILNKFLPKGSEIFDRIRYILETADPVKFAKLQPLPEENDHSMECAIEFVEATKYVPQPINEENKDLNISNIQKNV